MENNKKYQVVPSKEFYKELRNLSDVDKKRVVDKLLIFEDNPFHPSFRTKKTNGNSGYYESSINMDIRILWYFEEDRIIILTDVGHHDVLKKY